MWYIVRWGTSFESSFANIKVLEYWSYELLGWAGGLEQGQMLRSGNLTILLFQQYSIYPVLHQPNSYFCGISILPYL